MPNYLSQLASRRAVARQLNPPPPKPSAKPIVTPVAIPLIPTPAPSTEQATEEAKKSYRYRGTRTKSHMVRKRTRAKR